VTTADFLQDKNMLNNAYYQICILHAQHLGNHIYFLLWVTGHDAKFLTSCYLFYFFVAKIRIKTQNLWIIIYYANHLSSVTLNSYQFQLLGSLYDA